MTVKAGNLNLQILCFAVYRRNVLLDFSFRIFYVSPSIWSHKHKFSVVDFVICNLLFGDWGSRSLFLVVQSSGLSWCSAIYRQKCYSNFVVKQ